MNATTPVNSATASGAAPVSSRLITQQTTARWKRLLAGNPVWFIGFALIAVFSSLSDVFLSTANFSNVLLQCSLIGFLAVGLTPVLISGNIDLSIGSIAGLSACLAVGLQPYGLTVALGGALGAGILLGFINGLLVEKTGVSSFIVTLAGMLAYRGLTYVYTGDTSISAEDDRLNEFASLSIGPFSSVALIFIFSVVVFHVVMTFTVFGRNTFAIGGNRSAAVNAGISTSRHVVANFALSGFMAAVCGVAMAANLSAAAPVYGKDYELWALIAVVLGGTRLRGGSGSLIGTLAAVLSLALLRNGLNLIGVSPFVVPIVMGATLIAVLIVDKQLNFRSTAGTE